jgi:superoxide dismutase, Fe-Mn family
MKQLLSQWGSVENFQNDFTDLLMKIQGSGYANLVYCKLTHSLQLLETKDQDPVAMIPGKVAILGIDAWEHSWYLKYKNEKKKYATEIWKIINWNDLEKRHNEAVKH